MVDKSHPTFVALGSRLRGIPEVTTLGLKPNFPDYTTEERDLILDAHAILYPTQNYAQFLSTIGKEIFPSLETYLHSDEKIKQTTLFYMLGLPHPRTRFYYHLHHSDILKDFSFPFVCKLPRCSARGRGVFKVTSERDLERYLRLTNVAYIQEFLPHDQDLRVILINYDPILSYWRIRRSDDFRANLSQGGEISFENLPQEGIRLAREAAIKCRFTDVGMDLIRSRGKWYVIEANMQYGRRGLRIKGLNLKEVIREKLLSGKLY
ncbi:MAG: hypothetical protein V2J25_14845 [Desulfatiglans sp.]|jgi:ribosomal protein S6--L-glutamate ligase|nr:hypothetical protein [Desulfatiglans sp.]